MVLAVYSGIVKTDKSDFVCSVLQGSVIGVVVGSSEEETKTLRRAAFKMPQQPTAGAKVMQVPPTPKGAAGRPTTLHELLLQLGLDHDESKCVEQDIDLEVSW